MLLPEPGSLGFQADKARTVLGTAHERAGARKGEAVHWEPARFHSKFHSELAKGIFLGLDVFYMLSFAFVI